MTIEQSSCEFQQPLELFLGNDLVVEGRKNIVLPKDLLTECLGWESSRQWRGVDSGQ